MEQKDLINQLDLDMEDNKIDQERQITSKTIRN